MAELSILRGQNSKVTNKENVSGLAVFMTALPPSFVNENIQKISSVFEAELLGIKGDYSDEVAPTPAKFSISGTINGGEEVKVLINDAGLAEIITIAGNTIDDLHKAIVEKINNSSYIHGFSADFDGLEITLNPREGLGGLAPVLSVEVPSNLTATISQNFSGGDVSQTKLLHYLIDLFFKYGNGELYLGIFEYGQFSDELVEMQNFAKGQIRQFGILVLPEIFNPSLVNTFQAQLETLFEQKTPAVGILSGNLKGLSFNTLPNLQELNDNFLNVFIGNNGYFFVKDWDKDRTYKYGDTVKFLNCIYQAKYETKDSPLTGSWIKIMDNPFVGLNNDYFGEITIPLAVLSEAPVHENIGWVGKYDLSNDLFIKTSVLGVQYEQIEKTAISTLEIKNYTFFRFYENISGVFVSDTWTAIDRSNDYGTLENNRVFNKAVRLTNQNLAPLLNSPLYFTSDGKLKKETLGIFFNEAEKGLRNMKIAGEISGYKIEIDSEQDVLNQGFVKVLMIIQPVGVARKIIAEIKFQTTLK